MLMINRAKRTYRVFAALSCVLMLAVYAASCSHEPKNAVIEDIRGIAKTKKYADIAGFYTSGTQRAARDYEKLFPKSEILRGMDRKIFVPKAKWRVIKMKRDGKTALLEIEITSHPAQNLQGLVMIIPVKIEDSRWKIDREDEITAMQKEAAKAAPFK